jgi:hypothetical protein
VVLGAAIDTLGVAIDERVARLRSFLAEREQAMPQLDLEPGLACPSVLAPSPEEHVAWLRGLDVTERVLLQEWLGRVAAAVAASRA